MREYCIMFNSRESDKELFFGPIKDYDCFIIDPPVNSLHQLLKYLGLVKSNKQAKDVNMFGSIPKGFTDYTIGKKKRRLTILNIEGE